MSVIAPEKVGLTQDMELRARNVTRASEASLSAQLMYPAESYADLDEIVENEKPLLNGLIVSGALDIFVSLSIAVIGLGCAYRDDGVTLLCIGLQGITHVLSSVLIIRRFWKESRFGKRDSSMSTLITRHSDMHREQKYGIMIGIILLLSCVGLLVKAARKFRFWDEWAADHSDADTAISTMTEILAWTAGAWYLLQTVFRVYAQYRLDINLLNHAWPVSAVGFVFCLCMALAASYEKEGTWKADAICAVVLALITGCEGFRTIFHYFDDVDELLQQYKRP
eukprot:GEMP01032998.1.p1 GENE.GEMP01032998.1~~GEMP01032998.1.p1  ORF type:complete len:281 (+),score=46.33 GEMP01032998.1:64-906(+)